MKNTLRALPLLFLIIHSNSLTATVTACTPTSCVPAPCNNTCYYYTCTQANTQTITVSSIPYTYHNTKGACNDMLDSVTINTIPFVQAVSGGSINLDTLPLNLSFDPNVEHYICEQLTNVSEYCNCDVQDTNFGTETVYHGTTSTFWETDNVECGKTCKSETRTCTNGVISGTGYTVPNSVGCTVGSCLYGENHTPEDCTGSGGAVETLSDNAKICNFPGYCRFGWSQYLNYSITTAKTCEKWDGKYCEFWSNGQPGTCNQCNSMTMSGAAYPAPEKVNCTTGSHATMSNIARETCSVVYHQCGITSPPGCPITSCGLKEQTEVCKADITAIACY